MKDAADVDYVIVGGGFYGCCLALYLRSISKNIILVEAGDSLLSRSSRVNQARIHTGFHYPRSALTAVKSMVLHRRFAQDFPDAVVSDFRMLYAIARRHSKVSAHRFYRMFADMGAPIEPASAMQQALFNPETVEAAFACQELAFDHSVLRRHLGNRLDKLGIDVRLGTSVIGVTDGATAATVQLSDGSEIRSRFLFNVTYSQINHMLRSAGLPTARLKHELAELALIEPPAELRGFGLTVMDGPFFSSMPYPSEQLYSLTHVRYTPHISWTDEDALEDPYSVFRRYQPQSRARHMLMDAQRYVPCLGRASWQRSLYDVKTILIKNELDDGRPIFYQRAPAGSRMISILGGKIDNIYDLFDLVRTTEPEWAQADDRFVTGLAAPVGA